MDNSSTIRTEGDGTENPTDTILIENILLPQGKEESKSSLDNNNIKKLGTDFLKKSQHNKSFLYNPSSEPVQSFPPEIIPKGKKFFLTPKLVPSKSGTSSQKNKNPKFLPFEPYKAAVNPIIPFKNGENKIQKQLSKNNMDIQQLCKQLELTRVASTSQERVINISNAQISENSKQDCQINELKRERDYFENQLKFQVQVNTELKNLLVAAVGEDVQSKVNVLTEDKLTMAEHLSTHTEQIEYLAGQAEVWRSKFLASSLMVEELARWKASLTQKNNQLSVATKQLLHLTAKLRDMQIEVLQNLTFVCGTSLKDLPSSNAWDLTSESVNLSQQLVLQHSDRVGMPNSLNIAGLDSTTNAEKLAYEALKGSTQQLIETEDAFRAICSHAFPTINAMKRERETDDGGFEIINKTL